MVNNYDGVNDICDNHHSAAKYTSEVHFETRFCLLFIQCFKLKKYRFTLILQRINIKKFKNRI